MEFCEYPGGCFVDELYAEIDKLKDENKRLKNALAIISSNTESRTQNVNEVEQYIKKNFE